MARTRMENPALSSFDDVAVNLKRIGEIDRELGLIEHAQNEQIDAAKAAAKNSSEPLQDEKSRLEREIKEFCEANRGEFIKTKTRVMTFGEVGFRLSTKVVIKRVADSLAAIKAMVSSLRANEGDAESLKAAQELERFIRRKEDLDKEEMKKLSVKTLSEIGAALKHEDTFGYEVAKQELAEA